MWGRGFRRLAVGAIAAVSVLAFPAFAWAGGPGVWTKLASTDNSSDTAGMLRTADGQLHLVWLAKRASNNTLSYKTSTISLAGKLVATGSALSNWQGLEPDPQLVRDGSGMRLVFEGNTGSSGCFANGVVFTETSPNGKAWTLVTGSMDQHTAGVGNLAATVESDGTTPVAAFASGSLFHVGVDPNCPASSPDGTNPPAPKNSQSNPAIVTDSHDGSVWVATYQTFAEQGYWVDRILPSQAAAIEAPGSAGTALKNNQPLEPVALAPRAGGGVFMAYCTTTSSQPCAHIDLWKVGSSNPKVVPGSKNVSGARVALTAGPNGRLWLAWYDGGKNVVHAVRTNTAGTSFGVVRTIKPPSHTDFLNSIQAQGSSGRLDVIVNDQLSTSGIPVDLFHSQVLAGLSLKAQPGKFSHTKATTVTFTVTDAGQAVSGSTVSCIGKKGTTGSTGKVKITYPKGTATGKHVCTASKSGYNPGKTTIRVT